jgi:hypothetical protein
MAPTRRLKKSFYRLVPHSSSILFVMDTRSELIRVLWGLIAEMERARHRRADRAQRLERIAKRQNEVLEYQSSRRTERSARIC